MAKKTISVSALSNLKTTISKTANAVSANSHENTSATATQAPVLLTVPADADYTATELAQVIANRFTEVTAEMAARVLNGLGETLDAIVESATEDAAPNIDLGWAKFVFTIGGSLANSTSTPTLANACYFSGQVNSQFQAQYARIKAYTDTSASPCDLKRIIDPDTSVKNVISGSNAFYADGRGFAWGTSNDKQELYKSDGTKVCNLTLDTANSFANSMKLNIPATATVPVGEYVVRITCAIDGIVYPMEKTVDVIVAVAPTPALTKVKQGTRADNLVGFGTGAANGFVLTGTIPGGFKETDGLKLDGAPTTAQGTDFTASMSLASYVTASTDTSITIGDGIENDSEKPDEDWQDKACRIVLTRDGVEYPLAASFKNP